MMSVRCSDKERLVTYLYGEDAPEERAAVEAHLASCAVCAHEIEELGAVRTRLTAWEAPAVDLGFRVVREPEPAPRRGGWWTWTLPVWAQAAAAVLVLAAGAAIANVEVSYGKDGLALRTGWSPATPAEPLDASRSSQPPAQATAVAAPAAAPGDAEPWGAALAALETRLRADIASRVSGSGEPVRVAAATVADRDVLLRQVRALIDESERRQQRELALRVGQVVSEFEAQRRADLVRIEQNLGQVEGLTGQEVARQREMLNILWRTSQRR